MTPKSATALRKAHRGKYCFSFMVVSPDGKEATLYEGVLGAKTDEEMHEVASAFMDWIQDKGKRAAGSKLMRTKTPPGFVPVRKVSGEESE